MNSERYGHVMKKKLLRFCIIFAFIFVIVGFSNVSLGADIPSIYIDGYEIDFDTPPHEMSGRLLVPIRAVAESVGAEVEWDAGLRLASITFGTDRLDLPMDSKIAFFNGVAIPMDVTPLLLHGRLLLPLRFISEWLGLRVDYSDGVVKMYSLVQVNHDATMHAPRGNTNANLNNANSAIIWQNRLFFEGGLGIFSTQALSGLTSDVRVTLSGFNSFPSSFNIWNEQLYVIVNEAYPTNDPNVERRGSFIRIDAWGNILENVLSGVAYAQIHDGIIYFVSLDSGQLYRRPLEGGVATALGVYASRNVRGNPADLMLEIVITDQYIFTNDGWSILRIELDGSNRTRLLTASRVGFRESLESTFSAHSQAEYPEFWERFTYHFTGLEFANGKLFFSSGGATSEARIVSINIDGSGLQEIYHAGASEINIIDDVLYFTQLVPISPMLMSPPGDVMYVGLNISRICLNSGELEVLLEGSPTGWSYSSITLMENGSLYYAERNNADGYIIWSQLS